jgi:hypothetical protein
VWLFVLQQKSPDLLDMSSEFISEMRRLGNLRLV